VLGHFRPTPLTRLIREGAVIQREAKDLAGGEEIRRCAQDDNPRPVNNLG
jgi:hypothetical protein